MALPFLTKKSEAAAVPLVPSWHPNFRNYEKLPDVKQVRTAFFVNAAAAAVACVALSIFGLQEYKLHQLDTQIKEADRLIKQDKKKSDAAQALFKKFTVEEAKIQEVDTFIKSKPIVSDLIVRLGQTLPKNFALDSFDLRETGLALRLSVKGTGTTAFSLASSYLEQLRSDKELSRFESFEMLNSARNPNTGKFSVDVFLKLKVAAPPAPPPAPKK